MMEVEVNNLANLYIILEFKKKEIGNHLNFQNTETNLCRGPYGRKKLVISMWETVSILNLSAKTSNEKHKSKKEI